MPTTALTLARRFFRNPRPSGKVRPTTKLSVTQLEARDVPALYLVSLAVGEDGAGTKGDAGAEHSGSFTASTAYVEAETPAGAVALGLSGSLTVTLPWAPEDTKTYAMSVGQVGVSAIERRPFLLELVADDQYKLKAEDLADISYCDWDYDDRYYNLMVQKVETVAGLMWTDTNYDGIQTPNEPLMPGLTVQLMKGGIAEGSPVTTGADGAYSFTFLRNSAAVYTVQFAKPEGYTFTDARQGTDYRIDSDADASGMSGPILFTLVNLHIGAGLVAGPAVTLVMPAEVPVNANNDNFVEVRDAAGVVTNEADRWLSAAQKGIPKRRDFDVPGPYAQPDAQLQPVTVTVTGKLAGVVTIAAVPLPTSRGSGAIRFWEDSKKAVPFASRAIPAIPNGQPVTFTVFAEGTKESQDVPALNVVAVFTAAGGAEYRDDDKVAVTPALLGASHVIGSPNLTWNGPGVPANGLRGITTQGLANADGDRPAGIQFDVNVHKGLHFAYANSVSIRQNVISVTNGYNTVAKTGQGQYLAVNPFARSYKPTPASLAAGIQVPLVDLLPGQLRYPSEVLPDNHIVTNDSPLYNPGEMGPNLTRLDLRQGFVTYVVVEFADGSIYPMSHVDWSVNYFATSQAPGAGPLAVIQPASKVESSGWVLSNTPPNPTSGPGISASYAWQ